MRVATKGQKWNYKIITQFLIILAKWPVKMNGEQFNLGENENE